MSRGKKGMNPYLQDYFSKQAKKENFAARSAFKLEEIDKKHRFLKGGLRVLDLGAAPGSWSQYASRKVGPKGEIIGIDLQPIKLSLPQTYFFQADLLEVSVTSLLTEAGLSTQAFDLVLSDMAPKTTGVKFTDQMKSMELCEMALKIAEENLKPGGHFVCKLFHSDEFKNLKLEILKSFQSFDAIKPKSTRKISKEVFLVGLKKK